MAICLLYNAGVHAQHTEYSIRVGSGFFHFAGNGATSVSTINRSGIFSISSYTNNPAGTQSGFSYGVTICLKRLTKRQNIYGIDVGYESLQSSQGINKVWGTSFDSIYSARGKSFYRLNYINFNPFIGKRVYWKNLAIDMIAGADLAAYPISSHENAYATIIGTNTNVTTDKDLNRPPIDVRWRFQMEALLGNWALNIGYSFGKWILVSYVGGSPGETYTRYVRVGISYKIKKQSLH